LAKCILIFDELHKCFELFESFNEKTIYLKEKLLIIPSEEKISEHERIFIDKNKSSTKIEFIEEVRLLNPKLDRSMRQKSMSNWLMPFGFIAGLTFSNMTNLSTFAFLGLNQVGDSIVGGLLGMVSGLLGSFVASSSINLNRGKEIRSILNFNKQGKWIILLENQIGYELPWIIIREAEPRDMVLIDN